MKQGGNSSVHLLSLLAIKREAFSRRFPGELCVLLLADLARHLDGVNVSVFIPELYFEADLLIDLINTIASPK